VRQIVELCGEYGRQAATVDEARALLSLPSSTAPAQRIQPATARPDARR